MQDNDVKVKDVGNLKEIYGNYKLEKVFKLNTPIKHSITRICMSLL